ncbi:hypothetical protein BDY21DRAFT_422631 [Lineolata rhizophorae]|uniref:Branchpoint-bridging protein n=1 Tax=Lineolata rhizophorae TaxID=578093 RepID=A0A6A6NVN3_9PEZI|nr:hypothetical protein BDY21DRAFT_422631 [Lineolata rhizophorae]
MSWRNQGITGSNNIPLGNRRRFGGDTPSTDDGGYNPSAPATGLEELTTKRGRSPSRELNADGTKRRKKRNRWGDATENKAAGLMGLPTAIMANMTSEQLEAYTLHLRIEEISQKLRINDVVPADGDRSPSPPPQYDNFGRRVNTREYRYRKRLEDERHKLVEKAIKSIPNYHPPSDYRRPTKTQEKVYVPVNDYPEINFIGLLIGPRGNTLKKMESESGAKIAIRGKGSVKEGKGRSDAAHTSNQEEDLHCLIMADTEDKVNKAKKLIHNIIETAASIPEGQNELKRNQLRELAALNGTLRDDENQACQNCGQIGHRKYDCPEARNFTANIICRVCGNAGHMARDCPDRARGSNWRNDRAGPAPGAGRVGDAVDREYDALMQELTGGGPGPQMRLESGPGGDNASQDGYGAGSQPPGRESARPWQRGPTGAPAPWHRNSRDDHHGGRDSAGGRAAPPWAAPPPPPPQHAGSPDNAGTPTYPWQQAAQPPPPPPAAPGAAPWHQSAPPPPPGGNPYSGYPGYPGYDAGYGGQQGAPPGLGPLFQHYGGGPTGTPPPPPPPPPGDAPPPPPPSDQPPPPPPPPSA